MLGLLPLLLTCLFPTASAVPSSVIPSGSNYVTLRIEGLANTIYEGPILSGPRNITTPSGGTHLCDGTNNGANPNPGNTPTAALDAASKLYGIAYDGTYSAEFADYFITSIGTSTQTATQFWGVLVNYEFTPTGGCQSEVKSGDQILWVFDAFNQQYFLKVEPRTITVQKDKPKTVTVTDGSTGTPISGAVINGVTTDANGKATLTFPRRGVFQYKATKSGAVRSNVLVVLVV